MRKRIAGGALALALALVLTGCGGSDEESDAQRLDCAWVASPDNCWAQMLEKVRTCTPDRESTGTFSADRTSCTYDDGASILFDDAVPMPYPDDGPPWHFEVKTAAGERCVRVDTDADDDLTVEGDFGTLSVETRMMSMRLTCPDGSAWETDPNDPFALLECEGSSLFNLPGIGKSWSDTFVSVFLNGDPSAVLFDCSASNP